MYSLPLPDKLRAEDFWFVCVVFFSFSFFLLKALQPFHATKRKKKETQRLIIKIQSIKLLINKSTFLWLTSSCNNVGNKVVGRQTRQKHKKCSTNVDSDWPSHRRFHQMLFHIPLCKKRLVPLHIWCLSYCSKCFRFTALHLRLGVCVCVCVCTSVYVLFCWCSVVWQVWSGVVGSPRVQIVQTLMSFTFIK